eukprot:CAMPEP_0174296080 /NCGR_PEP_ID=MMETSP0809-20121228/46799_1 /TAXON_ID=73025 ORGANISM="Eutreptiella gymnastica-like, Strain CCMP1594" /NCGR_SAMPLE_ID=MMETSP0809 /ASSEMBLY_ACC=CAM_ASM_000658 /LENGTH=44 /DNA_ID= /DNA_START= /DNA_END= /DNA_ORIENTATION=
MTMAMATTMARSSLAVTNHLQPSTIPSRRGGVFFPAPFAGVWFG